MRERLADADERTAPMTDTTPRDSGRAAEIDVTIHERLARIVGCSVGDERVDALYDFIAADRQIEAAQAWDEGFERGHSDGLLDRWDDECAPNPYRPTSPSPGSTGAA